MRTQAVNGLPPIHPGECVREALQELGMSQAEFARTIGVSPMRIAHLAREERPVTANWLCGLDRRSARVRNTGSTCTANDLKVAPAAMKTA